MVFDSRPEEQWSPVACRDIVSGNRRRLFNNCDNPTERQPNVRGSLEGNSGRLVVCIWDLAPPNRR